jgi:mannose-1-phosphate guanylyltransferase
VAINLLKAEQATGKPLRALLLAAGFGTRLRPLTLHTPKCLVPIGGQPLLAHWLHQLELISTEAALVNTHYLADQVEEFLISWQQGSMRLKRSYEPSLLGTAGSLLANQEFFTGYTGLLIHADNFSEADLGQLLAAHYQRPAGCLLTMLTFTTPRPSSCGIVEIDEEGIVVGFHEKVAEPPGNRANGALYVFDQQFLDWLAAHHPNASDFSTEVLPHCLGSIYTWHTSSLYIDIGTPEALAEAESIRSNLIYPWYTQS